MLLDRGYANPITNSESIKRRTNDVYTIRPDAGRLHWDWAPSTPTASRDAVMIWYWWRATPPEMGDDSVRIVLDLGEVTLVDVEVV